MPVTNTWPGSTLEPALESWPGLTVTGGMHIKQADDDTAGGWMGLEPVGVQALCHQSPLSLRYNFTKYNGQGEQIDGTFKSQYFLKNIYICFYILFSKHILNN